MDKEFRKPYEYEEDKKGLIILFIIMILGIDILQTVSFVSLECKYFGSKLLPVIGFILLGVMFIIYIIYTSVTVFKMKADFVKKAKRYILIRTLFSVLSYVIIFIGIVRNENLIGNGAGQYHSFKDMIIGELVVPLMYIISFSVIWYLYFSLSKRCKRIADGLD